MKKVNGFGGIIVLPILCVMGFIALFHISKTIEYSRKNKNSLPSLALLLGGLIAFYLPLPPTPTELFFKANQADYENLVQLALGNQLSHDDMCFRDHVFAYPPSFQHLKESDQCITVTGDGIEIIEFTPLDFYHPIVFFANPNLIEESNACHDDGRVVKKLEDHWYLCKVDWN